MSWHPPHREVWRAIDVYLEHAYPGEPPSAVCDRLETLHHLPKEDFFDNGVFEKDAQGHRLKLRLGNRLYPHMKLILERTPDGKACMFRADTHDQHICPTPGSPDYKPFCQLMAKNQELARTIEAAWAAEGVPTFKTYLKQDLQRRAGGA